MQQRTFRIVPPARPRGRGIALAVAVLVIAALLSPAVSRRLEALFPGWRGCTASGCWKT